MNAVYVKLEKISDGDGGQIIGERAKPEDLAKRIAEICMRKAARIVILEDDSYQRELAARIAVFMNARCLPEVVGVEQRQEKRCFIRETYQANMYAYYEEEERPFVLTVRGKTKACTGMPRFCEDVILICGYGIGNRKNAAKIVRIAEACGFGVGATRSVVTSGWLSPEYLVGISGTSVSPKYCVVLGASGSQAFMAGIKDSKTIIAVNTDRDAPVFKKCDIGMVQDCMEFVRSLSHR